MKQSIYQIEQSYRDIVLQLEESGGEENTLLESQLAISKEELTIKGRNYGYLIKELESDNSIVDAEIKRLEAIKKRNSTIIEKLESTLQHAMELFGISEIKTETLKISFRKSESVDVDRRLIPEEFLNRKIVETPDKIAIKEALKNGQLIWGARLIIKNNLQIK